MVLLRLVVIDTANLVKNFNDQIFLFEEEEEMNNLKRKVLRRVVIMEWSMYIFSSPPSIRQQTFLRNFHTNKKRPSIFERKIPKQKVKHAFANSETLTAQ